MFSENVRYLLCMKFKVLFFLNGRYNKVALNFHVGDFLIGSLSIQTRMAVTRCRVVRGRVMVRSI